MYVVDWNGWLPYADDNASYAWYINEYLRQNVAGGFEDIAPDSMRRELNFGRPNGILFCPELSKPPESGRCWTGGSSAKYYQMSYRPTRTNADLSTYMDPRSGTWLYYNSSGKVESLRRFETIKTGGVILGDQDWASSYNNVYRSNFPIAGYVTGLSLAATYTAYAPGWMHSLSSNFLFKDGHVSSYKYTGTALFDNDYIPR